jgi:L-lactate dehydrogenase complex protein LldG
MAVPDQRDVVFTRIREALQRPAPHRHDGHVDYNELQHPVAETPTPTSEAVRTWLPSVSESLEEQIDLFAKNLTQLKADFRAVASPTEAIAQVTALAKENGWKRIATHRHSRASLIAEKLDLPCLVTDGGYAPADLEKCDVAITGCDVLVAQTGSILVTPSSAGGRALSVLPPHHVVVATRDQMVRDLVEALQVVRTRYAPNWPSMLSFITGPSRTGDIERILVLGAHGPKKLTVFLLP